MCFVSKLPSCSSFLPDRPKVMEWIQYKRKIDPSTTACDCCNPINLFHRPHKERKLYQQHLPPSTSSTNHTTTNKTYLSRCLRSLWGLGRLRSFSGGGEQPWSFGGRCWRCHVHGDARLLLLQVEFWMDGLLLLYVLLLLYGLLLLYVLLLNVLLLLLRCLDVGLAGGDFDGDGFDQVARRRLRSLDQVGCRRLNDRLILLSLRERKKRAENNETNAKAFTKP